MIDPVITASVPLDLVLLGSWLAVGPLELVLSAILAGAWLLFGAWLWRTADSVRRGGPALVYGVAAIGLFASVLAQDAVLFYAGLAVASYATVAAILFVNGPAHARTAAVQVVLLVLGDLILFELLVYLYSEAQTVDFDELRAAYQVKGGALSFVGALLVAAGGCRIAVLFLVLPLPGPLRPWPPGAAPGLFCTALSGGVLIGARIIDPGLSAPAVWYMLSAMVGAALILYPLAVICVLGKARIDSAFRVLSAAGSRAVSLWAGVLVRVGERSARLAPRLQALERRLLSWPVAVATATAFAVLLALAVVFARAVGST